MPIPVTCQCGQKLAARDSLAGKRVKCPKCGKTLAVPAGSSSQANVSKLTAKKTASRQDDANKDADDQHHMGSLLDEVGMTASRTGRRCPECFSDMVPEAIICIECGFNTETGRRLRTKWDIVDRRK